MRDRLAGQHALVGLELARGFWAAIRVWASGIPGGVQLQPGAADLELLVVLQVAFLDLLPSTMRAADAVQVDQVNFVPSHISSQCSRETPRSVSRVSDFSPRPIGQLHALDQVEGAAGVRAR